MRWEVVQEIYGIILWAAWGITCTHSFTEVGVNSWFSFFADLLAGASNGAFQLMCDHDFPE